MSSFRTSPTTSGPSSPNFPPNSGGIPSDKNKVDNFLGKVNIRRRLHVRSTSAHLWAICNVVALLLILWEINFRFVSRRLGISKQSTVANGTLYTLLSIFVFNIAFHLWNYWFPLFGKENIVLGKQQMDLLAISPKDPGFQLSQEKSTPISHPNPFSPPKEGNFLMSPTSPSSHSSPNWSILNTSSPVNNSMNSSSWMFQDLNATPSKQNGNSFIFRSSFDSITDERSLNEYLEEYNEWERQNMSIGSEPSSPLNTTAPSFWKPGPSQANSSMNAQSYTSILSRLKYQMSTSLPGSKDSKESKPSGVAASKDKSESICYRVGIDPFELVSWMENLRMWISQTILVRLVKEIEDTNKQLINLGMTDVLLGEAGLEKVRKCSQMPVVVHTVPAMVKVLPFLEVTIHQDYLVDRIRQLSKGGAMSEFRWSAGGRFKGSDWTDKWPSDSEIVMHCVACFFDSRLPPVKGIVDGRVFTSLYYFRLPDKPKDLKVPCAIVQTSNKPPHYMLQVGEDKLELNAGRNNMLHTILLFLHHIKTKENGILGRVNLGRSGINVLWVIE